MKRYIKLSIFINKAFGRNINFIKKQKMQPPGFEPESKAWEAFILTTRLWLHY